MTLKGLNIRILSNKACIIDLDKENTDIDLFYSNPDICAVSLVLGFFDGLHLGHRALIDACLNLSKLDGSVSAALFLEPHPLKILRGESEDIQVLITIEEKIRIIKQLGIKIVFLKAFDQDFARLTPDEFIYEYLVDRLKVKNVIIGYNYSFGAKGKGTPETLKTKGDELGFNVTIIEPVIINGLTVSSSIIRAKIKEGNFKTAEALLGRPYYYSGLVAKGRRLGHELGYPTANLTLDTTHVLPPFGVYSAKAILQDNSVHCAAVNIGMKPTIDSTDDLVAFEAHLIGFSGDIYGQQIKVNIIERIRPEICFESLDALKTQIQKDVVKARQIYNANRCMTQTDV